MPKDLRRCPSPDSGPGRWLNQRLSIRQNIVHFPGQPIVSRIVLVAAETVRSAQPPTSRNYHRVACTSRTEQSRYPIPSAPDLGRYGIGSSIGESCYATSYIADARQPVLRRKDRRIRALGGTDALHDAGPRLIRTYIDREVHIVSRPNADQVNSCCLRSGRRRERRHRVRNT